MFCGSVALNHKKSDGKAVDLMALLAPIVYVT
ncbi:MAG: hypothetical protein ACI8VC_000654, partial [Candidatus Endobugula sp.]